MLRGPVQFRLTIKLSKDSVFEERENQQLPYVHGLGLCAVDGFDRGVVLVADGFGDVGGHGVSVAP